MNFNEQTATAVFGGFQDKKFGNTLLVRPSVNKDNFITLTVKPEISNKVGDADLHFAGATVASPIIDTRSLDSNVLIKSGDTLAIGGLLQDEVAKARTKVPVLGDIPMLGYLVSRATQRAHQAQPARLCYTDDYRPALRNGIGRSGFWAASHRGGICRSERLAE